jgi:hypothetical protein
LQHANRDHDVACGRNQRPGQSKLSDRGGWGFLWSRPSNDHGARPGWEDRAYFVYEPGRSLSDARPVGRRGIACTAPNAARRCRPGLATGRCSCGRTAQRRRGTRRPIGVAGRAVAWYLCLYFSREISELHPRFEIKDSQRNQLWRGCPSELVE